MSDGMKEEPNTGGEDPLNRLRAQVEERQQERASQRRTEVRGTRLSRSEARKLDRRAETADLDVSSYMRLMCLGERPDMEAFRNALQQVRALVSEFEASCQDEPPSLDQVHALRRDVERIGESLT